MHPVGQPGRIPSTAMVNRSKRVIFPALVLCAVGAVIVLLQGTHPASSSTPSPAQSEGTPSNPLALVLTPLSGDQTIDKEIAKLQGQIKDAPQPNPLLERLGWAFVTKARLTSDPGFYKLAEQCASAISATAPQNADADLLRGHIFHALHRFRDAESVARGLVAQREFVFDYALLGDALMEQGRLNEAVGAYQKMVDLKPCLQTYSRVAHMRWLKGDLAGAIAAARLAVSSGSSTEPEPLAWASTRLAFYLLQQNESAAALAATDEAVRFAPDYAPALLVRGRALLAQANVPAATAALQRASELSPLPEYLWTLADALRANGQGTDADAVEKKLRATGSGNDPRTLSLFLASRATDGPTALRLAQAELRERQDVFTHDAVAWAEFANGHLSEAKSEAALALTEGTQDPRLLYHAGTIAAATSQPLDALALLNKANEHAQALLPSERADLTAQIAAVRGDSAKISSR